MTQFNEKNENKSNKKIRCLIFIVTGIIEHFFIPSYAAASNSFLYFRKLLSIDHDLRNVFIMLCVSSKRARSKRDKNLFNKQTIDTIRCDDSDEDFLPLCMCVQTTMRGEKIAMKIFLSVSMRTSTRAAIK